MKISIIDCLWAKTAPYEKLYDHLVCTGLCAKELLTTGIMHPATNSLSSSLGLSEQDTVAFVSYIASVHDIGKIHPYFQAKNKNVPYFHRMVEEGMLSDNISNDRLLSFRHEKYTADVLQRLLNDYIKNNDDLWMALFCAESIHHQGKRGDDYTSLPAAFKPKEWETLQEEINNRLISEFSPPLNRIKKCENADATVFLILGIIILADWIASDYGIFSEESGNEKINSVLSSRGLLEKELLFSADDFIDLWTFISKDTMRELQKMVNEIGKNPEPFYLIEAPMGEGKTESALFLAIRQMIKYNRNGFYVALPTAATGTQMFHRVNRLMSDHRMGRSRLLHSTAWMIDEKTPDGNANENQEESDTVSQWLAPLRRGLLSQFSVGTIDQAMMSVLKVCYGVVRLAGLSNKVIVFDEIHAYDTYMQTIIETLLSWCRALGVPIVLLSATLPLSKKKSFLKAYGAIEPLLLSNDYPLVTTVSYTGELSEHRVKDVYMRRKFHINTCNIMSDNKAIAEKAVSLTTSGGCICVLVNTVKKAQDVYTELINSSFDGDVVLFHARFPVKQRQEIEDSVVAKFGKQFANRPQKSILVSTQVMEQSIDADFDAMITELAPIDLLLQRMGRVHRFNDTKRPIALHEANIYVLTSSKEYEDSVYAPILMQKTEALLDQKNVINTPEDMRECIEYVYSEETPQDERLFLSWAQNEFRNQTDAAIAQGASLNQPNYEYPSFADETPSLWRKDDETSNRAAKTRIGDGSQRVVLLAENEYETLPEKPDRNYSVRLLERSVAIPIRRFQNRDGDLIMPEYGKWTGGFTKGILFIKANGNTAHWNGYRLICDNKLGILINKE